MYQLRRATSYFRNHKFFLLSTFENILKPSTLLEPSRTLCLSTDTLRATPSFSSRTFCSRPSDIADVADVPSAIDYRSLLQENEFHELADSTIHHLLDKLENPIHAVVQLRPSMEYLDSRVLKRKNANTAVKGEDKHEYGDNVDIDGFDIDYGNEVLTVKLGNLGTYVVNKQTPNRQIWLSSPVSGPARFDWDRSAQAWVYRRNKASLFRTIESELEKLCGKPVTLS